MNNKGQSALEYLMTYGWALVVIIIVIAALFAFGIFNPPSAGTCTGANKFLYKDHSVSGGVITLALGNGAGSSVDINNVIYGNDFIPAAFVSATPDPASNGADFQIVSDTAGPVAGSGGYSGTIQVNYTNTNTGLPHSETITCTGSA